MNFWANAIIRSTTILAIAAFLCTALRRSSASTRHAILAVALVSTLVLPLLGPSLPSLPLPLIPASLPQQSAAKSVNELPQNLPAVTEIATGTESRSASAAAHTEQPRRSFPWTKAIAGIWTIGFAVVIGQLFSGLVSARRLLRNATGVTAGAWLELLNELHAKLEVSSTVRMVLCEEPCIPMATGVLHNVILFPPGATGWTEEKMRFVLAHELAHAKRRDGLMQLIVQIACALYWFNPLVWYVASRIRLERERACDDSVLNLGEDADRYASSLLEIARSIHRKLSATTVSASMAQGSHLETRLHAIVNAGNRRGKLRPAAAALLILFGGSIATFTWTVDVVATPLPALSRLAAFPTKNPLPSSAETPGPQASAPAPAPARASEGRAGEPPKWATVSIQPCGEFAKGTNSSSTPGKLDLYCQSVKGLVDTAYLRFAGGKEDPLNSRSTVEGGPGWISSDSYDIHAVATSDASRELMLGPMLQALLEDKFKLSIRRDAIESTAYALTVAQTGSRLEVFQEGSCDDSHPVGDPKTLEALRLIEPQPATGWSILRSFEPAGRPLCGGAGVVGSRVPVAPDDPTYSWSAIPNQATLEASKFTLADLAGLLNRLLDRPVIDKTGINGGFDFHLTFAPDDSTPRLPHFIHTSPASILVALKEQAGLSLEATTKPVEVLAIDHIERPVQ